MAQLAAVRSTMGTTGDSAFGSERDEVSDYIAGGIGAFGVGDPIEVGPEVANPWHFDGIDTVTKPGETMLGAGSFRPTVPRRDLARALSKQPTKPTPTLLARALYPLRSLFGYDPTMPTKGVVMRPESVGSQFASQRENYQNKVRFGTGSFLGGSFSGAERSARQVVNDDGVMEWQQQGYGHARRMDDYDDYESEGMPEVVNVELTNAAGMMYAPMSSKSVDEGADGVSDSVFAPLATL